MQRWTGLLGPLLLFGLVASYLPAIGYAQTLSQLIPQSDRFWGYLTVSANPAWKPISPEQAALEEQQLQADPENEEARLQLLVYYWYNHMRQQRVDSISWLIAHHPESRILGLDVAWVSSRFASIAILQNDAADLERVRSLWETTLYQQAGTAAPEALHNAARFFEEVEPEKTIELAKRLQQQDPAVHTKLVASLYSQFLIGNFGPSAQEHRAALQTTVMQNLMQSSDPALIGAVARQLVEGGSNGSCGIVLQLVTRARQLEPQNQQWSDLMEGAKALPCGGGTMITSAPVVTVNPVPSQIRVGGMVQASNLIQSVPPEYPALARQARVEGVVSFKVVIGKDGHITNITLVSGHPLLVQAAMQAVRQYVYKPTLLNGQPVEVMTTVDIPFHLDAE